MDRFFLILVLLHPPLNRFLSPREKRLPSVRAVVCSRCSAWLGATPTSSPPRMGHSPRLHRVGRDLERLRPIAADHRERAASGRSNRLSALVDVLDASLVS